MHFSLSKMFGIGKSLKKQVLFFTIVPMIIGISFFSYFTISSIMAEGENRIKGYREELIARKKEELKSYVDMVMKSIEGLKSDQAIRKVKNMTYGESGYFWINDTGMPYPKMIMHPTIPSLDGQVMDDPKFNCALGKKENLFKAFVEVCMTNGEGFVDYLWPKPTKKGLTQDTPKLSYVRLHKPLGWVIGTGVYVDDIDALMAAERTRVDTEVRSAIVKAVIGACAIIIAYYFFVNYFISRYLSRPLGLVTSTIMNFTDDLAVRIPVTSQNEIGELANGFNHNIEKLRDIIKNVSKATLDIEQSVKDISEDVSTQAAISSEQSAAVAEITSTAEELSASSSLIAEHSKSVVDIASRTWENTKKGGEAIETVIVKMTEINSDNQKSINEILELGKKTKEISKIMDIINNIADQTKLIAFNAALEASSAGEAGKRFGVVAVEIRRLADSVMESTGEIESKINEIKEATNRLVIASEKGSKGIQEGMEYTTQTAELLMDVVNAAESTTDAAKQISLSTQQQKTASSQVVAALRDIVTGTNQTTQSINRIESISKGLMNLSSNLKELVRNFKLRNDRDVA